MKNVFLSDRFYWILGSLVVLFSFSYALQLLFIVGQVAIVLFLFVIGVDAYLLFNKKRGLIADRKVPEQIGLGDNHEVIIDVKNNYPFTIDLEIHDDLPVQFQERSLVMELDLEANADSKLLYEIKPIERGEYLFAMIRAYCSSPIGLIQRRFVFDADEKVKVYPSILQMKNMELLALSRISTLEGIKKIRRIGHNYEFEQIKDYIKGDDIRSINWKATGKNHSIMVNQFQDERAQQVYLVIDKSRSMELRFKEMSYLDYAINSSLVLANIALKKYDKAGLITFSNKVGSTLKADRSKLQLRKILEQLYAEKPSEGESDYNTLLHLTRKMMNGRSLLLLYSNFESISALEKTMPYLRRINKMHLLVLVFFEDEEIIDFASQEQNEVEGIFQNALAGKYLTQKRKMKSMLEKQGIQTILTTPEKLSIDSLNKYLELKSKGLI